MAVMALPDMVFMPGFRTDHDGPRWSLDSFHGGYSGHHIEFSWCSKGASPPRTSHPVASPLKKLRIFRWVLWPLISALWVQFHCSSFLTILQHFKTFWSQQQTSKAPKKLCWIHVWSPWLPDVISNLSRRASFFWAKLSNPWMIESGNEKQQGLTTYTGRTKVALVELPTVNMFGFFFCTPFLLLHTLSP